MENVKKKISSSPKFTKIREFVHPSNVTWKSAKSTTRETAIVLAFVATMSVLLAGFDAVLGFLLNIVV